MAIPSQFKPSLKMANSDFSYDGFIDQGWSVEQMCAEGWLEPHNSHELVTDVADTVTRFTALRDEKTRITKEAKDKAAELTSQMDDIADELSRFLADTKQESAKTAAGTVFTKTNRFVSNANRNDFMQFVAKQILEGLVESGVIPTSRYKDRAILAADIQILASDDIFAFFSTSLPKTTLIDFIDQNGTPPPGVAHTQETVIQVRK